MNPLIPQGLGPLRTKILEVALGELGVREHPPGSNRGERLDKYLPKWAQKTPGPPWCCFYACWVLKTALGEVPTGVVRGNSLRMKEDAENCGKWKDKDKEMPVPGDVGIMDKTPDDDTQNEGHTFIVLRVDKDGEFVETVEGNSGNRVRIGLRDLHDPQILGFIHTVEGERTDFYVRGLSGKGVPAGKLSTR